MGAMADADATNAVIAAGNTIGIYDERAVQALIVGAPGVTWDVGVEATDTAALAVAVAAAGNAAGLYDELTGVHLVAALAAASDDLAGATIAPDIVGTKPPATDQTIINSGHTVGTVTTSTSTTVAIGAVISQVPVATTAGEVGDDIAYLKSLGTTVPDSIDILEATFLAALTTNGLTAGTRTEANHGTILVGQVISSDPVEGAVAEPGSAVAYVVSLGV